MQDFLERHPSLLPGLGPDARFSSHFPFWEAVITQPSISGGRRKFEPDFLLLRRKTQQVHPILIEIEDPGKRVFHKNGDSLRAEFREAVDQLENWRAWFADPSNQIAFKDRFVPRRFLGHTVRPPQFVLIYGDAGEFEQTNCGQARRDKLSSYFDRLNDIQHLRWDQLTRNSSDQSNTITLRFSENWTRHHLAGMPPTFATGPGLLGEASCMREPWAPGWRQVVTRCLPPARAATVISRVDHWESERANFDASDHSLRNPYDE